MFASYPLTAEFSWEDDRVVTNTDLNNEFTNIYSNGLVPENIDDLSAITTDHKATSVPSSGLPTNLKKEIQEIRYQIDLLVGGAIQSGNWYDTSAANLQGRHNITPNGSFEWWSNGEDNVAPDGWAKRGTPTDVDRVTGEADNFGGSSAVEITSNGLGSEGITRTISNLKASTTYYVTVRAKATDGDTARIWTTGGSTNLDQTTTETSFTTIKGLFTTDSTPTDVVINIGSDTVSEVVFFDKLMITQGVLGTLFGKHINSTAPPGYYKGLVVESTSVTSVDVNADYLSVINARGEAILLAGVDLTLDVTVDQTISSVNGLDTSIEANNTSYAIWVIYNSTTGATAGLISTSFTDPQMPSNYDYKKLVSFFRNKNNNILPYHQRKNRYLYDVPTETSETTNVLSGGYNSTYTDVNCLSFTGSIYITRTAILSCYLTIAGSGSAGAITYIRPDSTVGEGKIIFRTDDEKAETQASETLITLTGTNNVFEYLIYPDITTDTHVYIDIAGCILDI